MSALAIEMTFEDVDLMVMEAAHRFHRRYLGTFEEWLSEAGLVFMIAYNEYDPTKGMIFSSYVRYLLDRRLMDVARKRARRGKMAIERAMPIGKQLEDRPKRQYPNLRDVCRELSDDAKVVIELLVDSPADIKLALYDRPDNEPLPAKMKHCLIEVLEDFGWTAIQIANSFSEIQEALC